MTEDEKVKEGWGEDDSGREEVEGGERNTMSTGFAACDLRTAAHVHIGPGIWSAYGCI